MKKNNKYDISSVTKFSKVNKSQKKEIILKTVSALMLLESSLVFAATGALTLVTKEPTIVPALLFVNTGLTAGMSLLAYKDAKKDNIKNDSFVGQNYKALYDKLYNAENIILSHKRK